MSLVFLDFPLMSPGALFLRLERQQSNITAEAEKLVKAGGPAVGHSFHTVCLNWNSGLLRRHLPGY